ncbi:hypothetical protein MKEN_01342300 [Mycena kentingensis (nom. inval.)]|nr:hypothetical protein MKEN_01342300 [Mycena kentingensis (nom. inval.)]
MPLCSGCSGNFPWGDKRCARCCDRDAGKENTHPQCEGCGATFPYLTGTNCGGCKQKDASLGVVHASLTPHNPQRILDAENVLARMAGSYANAALSGDAMSMVSKSKVRGIRAEPTIQMQVAKIMLASVGSKLVPPANQNLDYDSTQVAVRESLLAAEAVENVLAPVRDFFVRKASHSLQLSEIVFYYHGQNPPATIAPALLTGSTTTQELWSASCTGALLAKKHRDNRVLPLMLKIRLAEPDSEEPLAPYITHLVGSSTGTAKRKRKSGSGVDIYACARWVGRGRRSQQYGKACVASPHAERFCLHCSLYSGPAFAPAGAGAYRSVVPRSLTRKGEELIVHKISVSLEISSNDVLELVLGKEEGTKKMWLMGERARGETKKMSEVVLDGARFAAKEFYNVGDGVPPSALKNTALPSGRAGHPPLTRGPRLPFQCR